MHKHPMFVVAAVVFGFFVMCALAFWLGQQQQKQSSKFAKDPVKRFRAKPGTERENARALTSSIPSPEKERSKESVDEWGSLDSEPESEEPSVTEGIIRKAISSASPESAIQILLEQLSLQKSGETMPTEKAVLAYMYSKLDPPDMENSDTLFSEAWRTANTIESQVEVTYFVSKSALEQNRYDDVFATLNRLGGDGLPASGYALELGIITGMAYEGIGDDDAARIAYEHTMKQARTIGLNTHYQVRNAYRTAGFRLGNLHRKIGEDRQAVALGRSANLVLNP